MTKEEALARLNEFASTDHDLGGDELERIPESVVHRVREFIENDSMPPHQMCVSADPGICLSWNTMSGDIYYVFDEDGIQKHLVRSDGLVESLAPVQILDGPGGER